MVANIGIDVQQLQGMTLVCNNCFGGQHRHWCATVALVAIDGHEGHAKLGCQAWH